MEPLFAEIESWYARAPQDLSENERVRWVQYNAEIPCPRCGEPLWVMRSERSQNRGYSHLAMCQNAHCDFQVDD
jgi:predicted RNA-binding Zn-ribbon protein involved in translation (DUF1610 family)